MIALNSLTKPTGKTDLTCFFHTDESDFYDAYQAHLQVADVLSSHHLFSDAIYHLHFSVECFLKYAFCLIRKKHLNITSASQVTQWLTAWTVKHPFKKYLHSGYFSHDLAKLRMFFETETDVKNFNEWVDLVVHFPPDMKWVEDRYKPRNHASFSAKFSDYRQKFDAALAQNGPFGGVK